MSELDPLTPEPTDLEQTDLDQPRRGRKLGSRNKEKIDWYARREEIWDKMNLAIDDGAPAPAVIRALQSQLDTCNLAIANEADERRERQRTKELQKDQETVPTPVPAVPPVPATDPETERRLAKMFKQLEEQRQRRETPVPVPVSSEELNKNAAEAERDRKAKEAAAKKTQADADKKAKEDAAEQVKKAAKIQELKTLRESILKNMNTPGFNVAMASNPTFGRASTEGLKNIAAELDRLENPNPDPSPVRDPVRKNPEFDPEAHERRRAAAEERELTARMLEGERITAANRANARPAPISGGLGMCEGPEWNR